MSALGNMRWIGWVALAIAGLAVAAGVSLAASQLVSERIGLAAEPVSAGRELAPAGEHHGGAHHTSGGDRTATTTPTAPPTTTTTVVPTTTATTTPQAPTTPSTSPPPATSPRPGGSGGEHEGPDD